MRTVALFLFLVQSGLAAITMTYSGPVSISGQAFLSGNGVYVAAPVASFTASTTLGDPSLSVTFTDTSANTPTAWLWDFGDGNTSTSQSPTHSFSAGTWTVKLTASNAGGNSAATTNVAARWPVDVYVDMENSTGGTILSTTILSNMTHGAAGWSWTTTTNPFNGFSVSSVETALRTPVKCNGVNYDDSGSTRGWDYNHNVHAEAANLVLPAAKANVSVGFFLYMGSPYTFANGNFDYLTFRAGASDAYINLQTSATHSDYKIRIETSPGGVTSFAPGVVVVPQHTYWITSQYKSGVSVSLSVYDPSANWALLGTSTGNQDAANVTILEWGVGNNGATQFVGDSYFDDVVVDWTNAAFPLGP